MPIATLLHANITERIIQAFFRVYNELGFGFLESIYQNALIVALGKLGLTAKREVPIEVFYEGVGVGTFRYDVLVEGKVLVEVKAAERISEADERQLLNYLRATNIEVGLLLHFGPKATYRRFVYSNANKKLEKESSSIRVGSA
jgi:GxxExxY protein